MPTYAPGTPSWVDLSSPDVGASIRFYSDLFGWQAEPNPDPAAGGYTMLMLGGKTVAAVGPLQQEGMPPTWTTYVSVADADAAAAAARDAGGSVMVPPMDVLDAGRMAIVADPMGAVTGVWQPRNMHGADVVNVPGALCWNELETRDVEAAKAFYPRVFGWGVKSGDGYTEWTLDGNSVAGMMAMGEQWPAEVPSHWMVYFAVDDCDAAVKRAQDLGARVWVPPMDIPVGRFAMLSDPQGAMFSVIKLNR